MQSKKRSGKFYIRNEAETMSALGMKQVPGSGSSWVAREDGENEDVLCQLKSTDAESIRIRRQDIDALEHNAKVSHKMPVFAIQFLQGDDVYLLVKPQDITRAYEYISKGIQPSESQEDFLGLLTGPDDGTYDDGIVGIDCHDDSAAVIASSMDARCEFMEENNKKFGKVERSAV